MILIVRPHLALMRDAEEIELFIGGPSRMRTGNRNDQVRLPSLTPIWRGCEFQEREIFDLYGIVFDGHPDLRRILMWEEFQDYPMRKDYVEPDDYEYEPTAHDEVLEKAKRHEGQGTAAR